MLSINFRKKRCVWKCGSLNSAFTLVITEFNVKAVKKHLIRIMYFTFTYMCAYTHTHTEMVFSLTLRRWWLCIEDAHMWTSQISLGKNRRLAGSHRHCLLCPLWEVWQSCPLSKGFLSLLVLWLPLDTALPRRVLLSFWANKLLGSGLCSCFALWRALSSDRA